METNLVHTRDGSYYFYPPCFTVLLTLVVKLTKTCINLFHFLFL